MINRGFKVITVLTLLILSVSAIARAEDDMTGLLPPGSCGAGWKSDGKSIIYDRDTLSDRINGEAELYFPYGFHRMAAARYTSDKNPAAGMDVEIYRMGSPLDAFGMYANYRQKDGRPISAGTDSNFSGSQLFFYQERYFVHIQVTGADALPPDTLADCAKTVASKLPDGRQKPAELTLLERPEIIRGTERYLPQNLLGYDFLNRGLMADAVIGRGELQMFVLLGTTAELAAATFERYRSQLTGAKVGPGGRGGTFLEGVDPLYGPVIILKKGFCLAGALKFSGKKGIGDFLESVCR